MARLMWFISAAILSLGGWDLLSRGWLGWSGYLSIGVGVGIATAVAGSLVHDALAGGGQRLS